MVLTLQGLHLEGGEENKKGKGRVGATEPCWLLSCPQSLWHAARTLVLVQNSGNHRLTCALACRCPASCCFDWSLRLGGGWSSSCCPPRTGTAPPWWVRHCFLLLLFLLLHGRRCGVLCTPGAPFGGACGDLGRQSQGLAAAMCTCWRNRRVPAPLSLLAAWELLGQAPRCLWEQPEDPGQALVPAGAMPAPKHPTSAVGASGSAFGPARFLRDF